MERLAKRGLLVDSERVRGTGDAGRRSVSNHARLRVAGSKTATGCLRDSPLCREGQYGRSSRLPPAGNARDRLSCLRKGFCPVGQDELRWANLEYMRWIYRRSTRLNASYQ